MNMRKERADKGKKRGSDKTNPDRVFTFRLSPDNKDENAAIEAIDSELQRGAALRDVICDAIRQYRPEATPVESEASGMDGLLDRLQGLIDRLLSAEIVPGKKQPKEKPGKFNAGYLQNLKKAINGDDEG